MAQYRLGELFCGPGGIACGASLADIGNKNYSIVPLGQTIMTKILAIHTFKIFALRILRALSAEM